MRISQNGSTIGSIEDWFTHAPPKKGLKQWVDGRSAKELAKAFLESGVPIEPPELIALLGSAKELGNVRLVEAWPEHKIKLDSFRGETRNADMAAIGQGSNGTVAVTIESKADESFGKTIGTTLDSAPNGSNIPKRIEALAQAILGKSSGEVRALRYQLLHAVGATLIFAAEKKASAAVFVVMEFDGPSCKNENMSQNAADLDSFTRALSSCSASLTKNQLLGPLRVRGGETVPGDIPLFLGKITRRC